MRYAVACGVATILATTACGTSRSSVTAPTAPSPTSPAPAPSISITVDRIAGPGTVSLGETTQLHAWGELAPYPMYEEVTGMVDWSSSNPAVLRIASGGRVTGVSPGVVTVMASANGTTARSQVTVLATPVAPPLRIAIGAQSGDWFPIGRMLLLFAYAQYADRENQVSDECVWTSSNPAVAAVTPDGRLTTNGFGVTEIRATYLGVTGTLSVAVKQPIAITIDQSFLAPQVWHVGDAFAFYADATFADGTGHELLGEGVWRSSDPSVLRVSSQGDGTAVGSGTADVTLSYGGVTGSLRVTVAPR